MKEFDYLSFFKIFSNKNKTIETKDISKWIGCSDRYIQQFALKYDIPYNRIHGRKYYIWNEKSLLALKLWYERNNDRERKRYYIPVKERNKT
jgi:hypothetical protein